MKTPPASRPLDKAVERGYERPLIEDVTMARNFSDPEATLDMIRAGNAAFRPAALLAALTQAVA